MSEIDKLRRALIKQQAVCDRWAAHRRTVSTRARVTTANAQWAIACEKRDKLAARLYELTGEVLP